MQVTVTPVADWRVDWEGWLYGWDYGHDALTPVGFDGDWYYNTGLGYCRAGNSGLPYYTHHYIDRGLVKVDLTDVSLLSEIEEATLYATGASANSDVSSFSLVLVDGTDVSADTTGYGDLLSRTENCGSHYVPGGTYSLDYDFEIDFTEAGLAILNANRGGYAYFGLRLNTDINDQKQNTYNWINFAGGVNIMTVTTTFRVSSIRRVYRPGLYRMELSFGDLGFDVDVSEVALRKVPDTVTEPEPVEEADIKAPEDISAIEKLPWYMQPGVDTITRYKAMMENPEWALGPLHPDTTPRELTPLAYASHIIVDYSPAALLARAVTTATSAVASAFNWLKGLF